MKSLQMKTRQMVAILALGLGFAFTTAAAENEPEAPAPAGLGKIAVSSSGGITGRGDGMALTVEGDSTFEVTHNTKKKEGKLEAAEMEELKKLAAAVDWKSVKEIYNQGADQFASVLNVTIDGAEWSTSVSEFAPADTPKELLALLDHLKKLQRSHKP